MKRTLILLDDHAMIRSGLRGWFEANTDFSIAGEAGTFSEACALIDTVRESECIAVTDLSLSDPDGGGYDVLRYMAENAPAVKAVVFTSFCGGGYLEQAFRYGAKGFVSKNEDNAVLLAAIESVLKGETYIQSNLATAMIAAHDCYNALTKKELAIVELLAKSKTKEQIAQELHISVRTLENYLSNLYDKTYTTNKIELLERLGRRL